MQRLDELFRLKVPQLHSTVDRRRDKHAAVLGQRQISHCRSVGGRQSPDRLTDTQAPDGQLAGPRARHRLVSVDGDSDVDDGVQRQRLGPVGHGRGQVEDDVVSRGVVGTLRAGDGEPVVRRDGEERDVVGQPDTGVVTQSTQRLVAEHVPDHERRAAAEAVSTSHQQVLAVVQHTTRSVVLTESHLQRTARVEVPDLHPLHSFIDNGRTRRPLTHAINPLEYRSNYSATSNDMKLVQWSLMDGLLHLVQQLKEGTGGGRHLSINTKH